MADRYLKIILSVIALELFWIGMNMGASPVAAQQAGAPMPVIIRGVETAPGVKSMLPVIIESTRRPVQVEVPQPLRIESVRPIKIEADQPIKIESDYPLRVEQVPAQPALRPGI